jgi:arabinoxylan arabinofuranohydrolase
MQLRKNNSSPIIFFILVFFAQIAFSQNPFMPPTAFIPDGEPHVFEYKGEKRVFVYGSRDERISGYCGYGHDTWSAPINDLTKWTNHGEIFNVKQVWDIGYGIVDEQHFGAPDCVYNPKTKKYYLYTFLGATYKTDGKQGPLPGSDNYISGFGDLGPKCVMAVSDNPAGPFLDPVMCDWPPANSRGTFDPGVLVDQQKDGSIKVYAYWGMSKGDRWAEVNPMDMHTIINPETRKPDRNAWHKTLDPKNVKHSTLFEASSIRKIDDNNYVFIYSANEKVSALSYCYSNSPTGPWTYGGKIVQNGINWRGGNNHGSIVKALDQWYVVYHRSTNNSMNRQAMIEPIEVKTENGTVIIPEVEMTSQGAIVNGLDAFKRYNANVVCYLTNNAFLNAIPRNPAGLNPLVGIDGPATTIGFKYFNFGEHTLKETDDIKLKLNCKVLHPLKIQVFISQPEFVKQKDKRIQLAEYNVPNSLMSDDFKELRIPLNKLKNNENLEKIGGLKGKYAVFLTFAGKEKKLCELIELEFSKGANPTPNPLQPIQFTGDTYGKIVSTPSMARVGESVKLSVEPDIGYAIKELEVYDKDNKKIKVIRNEFAPYAPKSFNFFMPDTPVKVEVKYKKEKN